MSLESYNHASNNREKLENINLALESIFDSIKKAGSDIYTWIKNLLKKFLNWVTGWFGPSAKKINDNIIKTQKIHDAKIKTKKIEDYPQEELETKVQKVIQFYDRNKMKRGWIKAYNYLDQAFKSYYKFALICPAVTEMNEMVTGLKKWDLDAYLKAAKPNPAKGLWNFPTTLSVAVSIENAGDNDLIFTRKEAYNDIMNLVKTNEDYKDFMDQSVKNFDAKSIFNKTLLQRIEEMKKGIETAAKSMEKNIQSWQDSMVKGSKELQFNNSEKVTNYDGTVVTIDDIIQGRVMSLKLINKMSEHLLKMYYNLYKTVEAIAENDGTSY